MDKKNGHVFSPKTIKIAEKHASAIIIESHFPQFCYLISTKISNISLLIAYCTRKLKCTHIMKPARSAGKPALLIWPLSSLLSPHWPPWHHCAGFSPGMWRHQTHTLKRRTCPDPKLDHFVSQSSLKMLLTHRYELKKEVISSWT